MYGQGSWNSWKGSPSRWRQELESDSELSELASSAFDGIEGIEMGGDTAISTTVAAGDQETGQGMGGTGTGGDSEAQVPVFSPRKTRSGRIIK